MSKRHWLQVSFNFFLFKLLRFYLFILGVDIICAQGGEGGGHTGEIATSVLIPAVVDMLKGSISPLTGGPVYCVGNQENSFFFLISYFFIPLVTISCWRYL
jgi:hypothetical protein